MLYLVRPTLSDQIKSCLDRSDYPCLVNLSYKNSPKIKENVQKRQVATSLAYLGETEKAFDYYEELSSDKYSPQIVSAILVYLTLQDRDGEIGDYLDRIPDGERKLSILDGAWAKLRYSKASILHPELVERLSRVMDVQLDRLAHSEGITSVAQPPYALSRTHKKQVLEVAETIKDSSAKADFEGKVEKYSRRSANDENDIKGILALLYGSKRQKAVDEVYEFTGIKGHPEQDNFRFEGLLINRTFMREWMRSDSDMHDRLLEAFINESNTWDDPACRAATYVDLALLYLFSGERGKSVGILRSFEEKALIDKDKRLFCINYGHFSVISLQYLLQDLSVEDHFSFATQLKGLPFDERAKLKFEFEWQSDRVMSKAISFTTPKIRENFAEWRQTVSSLLLPEVSASPKPAKTTVIKGDGFFASIKPLPFAATDQSFLHWALQSGDQQQALSIISRMYGVIKNSSPSDELDKILRDVLLTRIYYDDMLLDGLIWSSVKAR